jgi:hypothetical protein
VPGVKTVNPFNNRWLALLVVAGCLLLVAELVGTGEHGGVLSQAAQSHATGDGAGEETGEGPAPEVIREPPSVIEEVPEDDLPQSVPDDQLDDTSDLATIDDGVGADEADVDAPIEDDSSED